MKKILLTIFYFIMENFFVLNLFYFMNRDKEIVLTYHNIIPDLLFDHSVHLGVSHCQSVFESHVNLIKKRLKRRKILITFDDGYRNQYEIASKILDKHNMRGIFFITFKLIDENLPLTVDKVMRWISYVPAGQYQVIDMQFCLTDENRFEIASVFYEKLLLNYTLWDSVEKELNDSFEFNSLKVNLELEKLRFEPMKYNELKKLILSGHVVAAHGWDHKPLSTLPIDEQEKDFFLCKSYADKYCNSRLYSYPYGGKEEVSTDTVQLCEKYGFSSAYMNNGNRLNIADEDENYQLPRISLPNTKNKYILEAKLSGFELFLKKLLRKL
ncbi:MAG: polysaccharide deacetylase family protein [Gammaproteobacteria bacterium]|nr:polysaccharide deacetylase family protein [Gammaproteobacteria bacterium]